MNDRTSVKISHHVSDRGLYRGCHVFYDRIDDPCPVYHNDGLCLCGGAYRADHGRNRGRGRHGHTAGTNRNAVFPGSAGLSHNANGADHRNGDVAAYRVGDSAAHRHRCTTVREQNKPAGHTRGIECSNAASF